MSSVSTKGQMSRIETTVGMEEAGDNSVRKSVSFPHERSRADDTTSEREETKSVRSTVSSRMGSAALLHRQNGSKSLSIPKSYQRQLSEGDAVALPKDIIYPWSKGYKSWFALTVIWSILTVVFEPYCIAFLPGGVLPPSDPASIIEYCFTSVFVVDLLVNFNLAFSDEFDNIVTDRKKIGWKYFKFWFWIDLIAVFPFYLCILAGLGLTNVDSVQTRNIKLVRLLRLLRIHRVLHAFEYAQTSTRVSLFWYTMARNYGFSLLWTHCAACGLYFIARQYNFQGTWIEPDATDTNLSLYLTSLYWSIVTFATGMYAYCLECKSRLLFGNCFLRDLINLPLV
jgi:hypothetical protein